MNRRRFLALGLAPLAPSSPPPVGPQFEVARPVNAQLIGRNGWASNVIQFDGDRPPPPLTFTAPMPDTYTCLRLTDGRTTWADYIDPARAAWSGEQATITGVAWPPVNRYRPTRNPDHD